MEVRFTPPLIAPFLSVGIRVCFVSGDSHNVNWIVRVGDGMARVGDGMKSKWYKLMGGEQRKRLWVLKTTSQSATGPKPKVRYSFHRSFVALGTNILWDGQSFFLGWVIHLLALTSYN